MVPDVELHLSPDHAWPFLNSSSRSHLDSSSPPTFVAHFSSRLPNSTSRSLNNRPKSSASTMYSRTLILAVRALASSLTALAQAEPYIGQIMIWSSPLIPFGWARCDGQLLPISQNNALFGLIGTTYGGDGTTVFALPNLIHRAPIHMGSGNGAQTTLGQPGGTFSGPVQVQGSAGGNIPISPNNLPAHSHAAALTGTSTSVEVDSTISVVTSPGQLATQAGGFLSQGAGAGVAQAAIFAPPSSNAAKVALAGISGSARFTPAGSVNIASTSAGQPSGQPPAHRPS